MLRSSTRGARRVALALGVLAVGSAAAAAPASAAAPAYDVPSGAAAFTAVTAENKPDPTELQSVLSMAETTADVGVPRCLGPASFARTAWARIPATDATRLVRVSATPNATRAGLVSTATPDLALFVGPADPATVATDEPQLCDGREILGDDARGEGSPDVLAVLPAGRAALVQVGWRDGEPQQEIVANLDARTIPTLPAPEGDDPAGAPIVGAPGVADVPLAGATLGQGDPAEPFCQARATVWRRIAVPAAGTYSVAADGAASTLTAFGDPVTGDSATGCVDAGDGAALELGFRATGPGTVWVRAGVDAPTGSASTRLTVRSPAVLDGTPVGGGTGGPGGPGGPGLPVVVPGRLLPADGLLQCTTRRVVLTNARTAGGTKVRLDGVAGTAAAGRTVALQLVGQGTVRRVRVAKDGTFSVTFSATKAGRARTARYRARLGSALATAIPLRPRFAVTGVRRSGTTGVVLKGRLSRPLAGRRTVALQVGTCSGGRARWRTAATTRRSASGAVSGVVRRPAGAAVVIVRATGTVRSTGRRARNTTVSTVPQAVGF